jgi:hypothetical protein
MFNLALLFINLLYVAVPLCIIAWLSCLLIRLIKYVIPQYRAQANIIKHLKNTINPYTVIVGICAIGIIVWFNYPQPVIPQNLKIQEMTIRIEACEDRNLSSYDQREIKISTKEKVDKCVELLNQYTCKRTSNPWKRWSISQGRIEIFVIPADGQKNAGPFWICITPGNELQNKRYKSANTSFAYMIQTRKNHSLSQELIDYIDKNAMAD